MQLSPTLPKTNEETADSPEQAKLTSLHPIFTCDASLVQIRILTCYLQYTLFRLLFRGAQRVAAFVHTDKVRGNAFHFGSCPSRVPNRSRPLQDAKITNHWGYEVVWCAYPRCFGCQDLCRLHASERYAQCRLSADQLRRDSNKRNSLVGALHLPHHMSPELPQTLKTSEDYIAVEDVRFG